MNIINCPGCGKKILSEETACPECGRKIRKIKGRPITMQFIVESEKISLFNSFIHGLSEYIDKNYDINDFSYSLTDVLDGEGKSAGYIRALIHISDDRDILDYTSDWVDNRLTGLDLYKNIEIYNNKFKAYTERCVCPTCKGTGYVTEEQAKEKCTCKNGFVYTKNICRSCGGSGRYFLGILRCRQCGGLGAVILRQKCPSCGGSGYIKTGGYKKVPCKTCGSTGYLN